MATVREAPSPPRREPPDWSVVPPPPARPRRAIAMRTIAGIAIVGALWWLGREVAATVLLVAIVVMTVGSLTIPAFAAVVERATKAVERVTGRLLATVLLTLVQALMFTPISLVLKLLRVDPLALGHVPDATSLWRTTPTAAGTGRCTGGSSPTSRAPTRTPAARPTACRSPGCARSWGSSCCSPSPISRSGSCSTTSTTRAIPQPPRGARACS